MTSEGIRSGRVIVTVLGKDQVGIIARVAWELSAHQVNILDISQTILQGFFSMIMVVDLTQATVNLAELQKCLQEVAQVLSVTITAAHEDVFQYMHRV